MTQYRQNRYDKSGPLVAQALQRRHFDAVYVSTKEEAKALLLSMIPKEDTVAFGGSQTLGELGVVPALKEAGYHVLDRDEAKTPQERVEMMRNALLSDTFLMSSNALSQDGQLVNLDGNGNRVAALIYGPKQVIVCVGMNKVVPTLEDAVRRVRSIAAPENAQRFGVQTPCQKNGQCADCISADCICAQLVVTRISRPEKRIRVILIGQELGM
jgi:L-lactate utilization protein LutB